MSKSKNVKILLINGSIASKSHTRALLKYVTYLLKELNIEVKTWDLLDNPLPFLLPEYHSDPTKNPNKEVQNFVKAVAEADGLILGSPLYHGSYSGVLKNALDLLAWNGFQNKVIGLVSNTGSIRAGANACEHLRSVVRALQGYPLVTQIATTRSDYRESENEYELEDEDIKERCKKLVNELVELSRIFKNKTSENE